MRVVETHCELCGEPRTVTLNNQWQSPVGLCERCRKAQKERRFNQDATIRNARKQHIQERLPANQPRMNRL